MLKIKYIAIIIGLLSLFGCESFHRHEDVVRIKPEKTAKYAIRKSDGSFRDGRTLHGTVVSVQIRDFPADCPDKSVWDGDTTIVFLDAALDAEPDNFELIPFDDIIPARKFLKPGSRDLSDYGNANLFETENLPLTPENIRRSPVEYAKIDTCSEPFDPAEDFLPEKGCVCNYMYPFEFSCIERRYNFYFVELRGAYAAYDDYSSQTEKFGRESFLGEIAAGFRFGKYDEWGAGVAFVYGMKAYNSHKSIDYTRSAVMLHGRFQSIEDKFLGMCAKPFFYGQFGVSIDELSAGALNFQYNSGCSTCRRYIEDLEADGQLPGIELATPISFGLGAGFEIPVASFMDVAFDFGYKNFAVGEEAEMIGFSNLPSTRRIETFLVRFGVTF